MSRAQALAALMLIAGALRAGAQVTPPPAMEHKPGMAHEPAKEKMGGMEMGTMSASRILSPAKMSSEERPAFR